MNRYNTSYWTYLKNLVFLCIKCFFSIFIGNVYFRQTIYSSFYDCVLYQSFKIRVNNSSRNNVFISSSYIQLTQYSKDGYSQKIIVRGIKNTLIQSKLISFLDIYSSLTLNIQPQPYINYCINQLKLSGFFKEVSTYAIIFEKKVVVTIHVKTNPILKKVSVKNYKNKLIPKSIVIFYFKNQVGLPKNFIYINSSLRRIQQWYYLRGYHLIDVHLLNELLNGSNTDITVIIHEGLISKIELIGYRSTSSFVSIDKILSINFLLLILDINIHQAFNVKYLEFRINRLKREYDFVECRYELVNHNSLNNTWSLILILKLSTNKSVILCNNLTNTGSYLDKLLQVVQNNSHEFVFYILRQLPNRFITQTDESKLFTFFDIHNFSPGLAQYINLPKLYEHFYGFLLQIYIISSTLFVYCTLDQYTSFHYYNPYRINETFTIYSILSNKLLSMCMKYKNSWIYASSADCPKHYLAKIYYFTIKYVYYANQLAFLLYDLNNYIRSHIINIQVKISCQIHKSYVLFKQIHVKLFTNRYLSLHNYINKPVYKLYNAYINQYQRNLYFSFKIMQENQLQKTLNLSIACIYYELQTIINTMKPKYIKLKYILFALKRFFQYNSGESCDLYHQLRISIKKHYYFYRFLVLCKFQFIKSLIYSSELFYPHMYYLADIEIVRGYSNSVLLLSSSFFTLHFEYYIPILYKNTIFAFVDYLQHLSTFNRKMYNSVLLLPFNWVNFNIFTSTKIGYGIGIQFIIPMHQVLSIKMECCFNIEGEFCLHLRMLQNSSHTF